MFYSNGVGWNQLELPENLNEKMEVLLKTSQEILNQN